MTIDQFLHYLQPNQIPRQTDRQTLICRMATLLIMGPPEKEDLSNKQTKKKTKIRVFV